MPERLPLLIGITGKRQFSTDAEADKRCEAYVANRLKDIFEALDRDYPNVPKILLTGAAYGTDLVAAHMALAQNKSDTDKRWAVAALLPFKEDEFKEDFKVENNEPRDGEWPNRYAAHLSSFEALMQKAASGRVIVRELPKLDKDLLSGEKLSLDEPWSPATKADLANNGHPRSWYYEQVGQFIAESADILIAVMPKEATLTPKGKEPRERKATGGTARIVAYRRIGRPDALGHDVAQHSAILRRKWLDLAAPPAGFVWLLEPKDPQAEQPTAADAPSRAPFFGMRYRWEEGPYPVEVLPPLEQHGFETYPEQPAEGRSPGSDHEAGPLRKAWHALRGWLETAHIVRPASRVEHQHQLMSSLISAKALEIFNNHKPTTPNIVADVSDVENLTQDSERVAKLISDTQMLQNAGSKRSFRWLAVLFVTALVVFEIYAKFFPRSPWMLLVYLAVLGGIAWVVFRARWQLFQAKSEDYRAVAEMMRVQHAWWSAGLPDRVDREHLQGVDRELARIRDGATGLIAWLLIRHKLSKPHLKWHEVRGKAARARRREDKDDPSVSWDDWVGSQLDYFSSKEKARLVSLHRSDAISWTLVAASAFMAAILFVWLFDSWRDEEHHPVFHCFSKIATAISVTAGPGCLAAAVTWAGGAALVIWFGVANSDLKRWPAILATAVLGLAVAFLLSFAVINVAPFGAEPKDAPLYLTAAKSMMVVMLVGLSAAAGALRYFTERLNVEAEAHEYRDAKERFERAEHLLFADVDSAGVPRDRKRAQELVRELGLLALAENEAWLKSRRERPLTPVVG